MNVHICFIPLVLLFVQISEGCKRVEIVSRSQWGGKPPVEVTPLHHPVKHAFISHTAGDTCDDLISCSAVMKSVQDLHLYRKWSNIGYNFVVGNDGRVYEGRGWNAVGAATKTYNNKSISISFMGNFVNEIPNVFMVRAAYNLLGCGLLEGVFTKDYQVHGHRDASCTESPGDGLYNIIKRWPRFVGGRLPVYSCIGYNDRPNSS